MAGIKKYRVLKRTLAVLILLFVSFCVYVVIVNRNSKEMTVRQKILKAIYPGFMWMVKKTGKITSDPSGMKKNPPVSFYALKAKTISGQDFDFATLKGKKVLIVNTASDCGYTGQYDELQQLYDAHKDKINVIGFPANDFKDQEKGSDEEIEKFCKLNYGVSFPLMKKGTVIKNQQQQEVFQWLTDPEKNGWNDQQPVWNFSKYLVDENGRLVHYFAPAVSPLDKEIVTAIVK